MSEQQPAVPVQKRTPMDNFDPSDDGFTPWTLEQTVAAAKDVLTAFDRLDEALLGCMTPLDLAPMWKDVAAARSAVAEHVDELKKARNIIEMDRPLVVIPAPAASAYFSAAENATLRPEQIIQIRKLVKKFPGSGTYTYREFSGTAAAPQLVRYFRAKQLQDEEAEDQLVLNEVWRARQKAAATAKRERTRAANRAAKAARGS